MKVLFNTAPGTSPALFREGVPQTPEDLSFAFYIGGSPGKYTCGALCEHCFISSEFSARKTTQDNLEETIFTEKRQVEDLQAQGFNVRIMIPDTFSWKGLYLASGLLHQNTLYDQQELSDVGVAWTSGIPLLQDDSERLLQLAEENNLHLVAMTSHGIYDHETPIKGVAQPSLVRSALKMIHDYNDKHTEKQFQISIGFPIGSHNLHRLKDYITQLLRLSVNS